MKLLGLKNKLFSIDIIEKGQTRSSTHLVEYQDIKY